MIKILVPIKRVLDYRVRVKVKPDKSGVDLTNLRMSINPFDEIAIEEAVRLKEKNLASEVILVTIGGPECQETLRAGLALGADRAILLQLADDISSYQLFPLQLAKILKYTVEQQQPDLVLMGKQSIDGDNNQTGQMLAGLLNWSQATYASKIDLDNKQIQITREVDGGLQTIEVNTPCVITTDLRLNEPRYPSLPNIMKAKSKKLDTHLLDKAELNNLGIKLDFIPEVIEVNAPPARTAGIKLESVEDLVDKLRNVEQVI